MKNLKALATNLKSARRDAKLTQSDTAAACGVDIRIYQRWEAGEHEPSSSNLALLASALGTTTEKLMAGVLNREIITIYPITVTKAYEMDGEGDGYAYEPYESDSPDYAGETYNGEQYYLPIGYTVGEMPWGAVTARDTSGDACDLIVHYNRPALVSAAGIRLLQSV